MQKKWWFMVIPFYMFGPFVSLLLHSSHLEEWAPATLWSLHAQELEWCLEIHRFLHRMSQQVPLRRLLIQLTSYWNANEGDFSKKSRLLPNHATNPRHCTTAWKCFLRASANAARKNETMSKRRNLRLQQSRLYPSADLVEAELILLMPIQCRLEMVEKNLESSLVILVKG